MTTTTATTAPVSLELREDAPRPISDAVTMAWRNLLNIRRNPQLLVFATIQPVIFVLMFRYVFGGAIAATWQGKPVPYVDFLMPGIFVQTVTFGALTTGVGLAEDLGKGLIDRFRSLPIARSAVLVGRTWADLVRNLFVVVLMAVVGFLVGWRIDTNVFGLLAALALVLAFAYSLSWVFAIVGLTASNAETAQAASFPILAPLVFASSAFVPLSSMPGWLQVFAAHQPVTAVCNAARALTLGGPTLTYVLQAVAWIAGIIVLCAPLAVRRYRRAA
jgi:ABC-2 type transport system permease protein/oleandomycin transport system permease protein